MHKLQSRSALLAVIQRYPAGNNSKLVALLAQINLDKHTLGEKVGEKRRAVSKDVKGGSLPISCGAGILMGWREDGIGLECHQSKTALPSGQAI